MQNVISDVVRELSATCEREAIFNRSGKRQIPKNLP